MSEPLRQGVRPFRVGSITSGIAAERVAIEQAGLPWEHAFFAEIAPFPCAVLKHHYHETLNLGDITRPGIEEDIRLAGINLLMASTPCQAFSVAGLRGGLADARGNLSLRFAQLCAHAKPEWVVWENVPGVLTSDRGEAFRSILAALDVIGYGLAWRVFDAQHFGLAQRRKRVFLVGHLGDRRAEQVLFEPESLRGDPPTRRATRPGASSGAEGGARGGGVVGTLGATGNGRGYRVGADEAAAGHIVAHTLRGSGFDASEDGTGRGTPLVASALTTKPYADNEAQESRLVVQSVALRGRDGGGTAELGGEKANALRGANGGGSREHVLARALTTTTERYDASVETFVYGIRSDATREGVALTPSPDAEGRVRLRDPGLGITEGLAPTVDTGAAHIVAFGIGKDATHDGRATPREDGGTGRDPSMSVLEESSQTMRAQGPHFVAVIPFQERGRADGRSLEVGGDVAYALTSPQGGGRAQERNIAVIPFDTTQITHPHPENRSRCDPDSPSPTLAKGARPPSIAFNIYPASGQGADLEASPTDLATSINPTSLGAQTERGTRIVQSGVRRLTPTECERLMGVPDGYTDVPFKGKPAADGPRYAALGNSIAVPCLEWIFKRIEAVR